MNQNIHEKIILEVFNRNSTDGAINPISKSVTTHLNIYQYSIWMESFYDDGGNYTKSVVNVFVDKQMIYNNSGTLPEIQSGLLNSLIFPDEHIFTHPIWGRVKILSKSQARFLEPQTVEGWEKSYRASKYAGVYHGLNSGKYMPFYDFNTSNLNTNEESSN